MSQFMQTHIDHIMDHFDFNRVERVMKALNWVWVRSENPDGIPDTPELRKEARRLLKTCWEHGFRARADWWVVTGGFTAKFSWEGGNPLLQLSFVAEDSLSEYV